MPVSIYSSIESHRSMVFDAVHNTAYVKAIAAAVTPARTVLDIDQRIRKLSGPRKTMKIWPNEQFDPPP